MTTEMDILTGFFELVPTKTIFSVRLTRNSLIYSKRADSACPCVGSSRPVIIRSIDVYGAKAFRGSEGDLAGYFQVYSCPFLDKKRKRQKICFRASSTDSAETNIALAERWVRTILWLVKEPERDVGNVEGTYANINCPHYYRERQAYTLKLS